MPVKTIILLRHGHRIAWSLDPTTGKYTSSVPFPSRLPADPPLASHGVSQAQATSQHYTPLLLPLAKSGTLLIYSSLFYRCLETLKPLVTSLNAQLPESQRLKVRGERGIGEWFGKAWFEQPSPSTPASLQKWFPFIDTEYTSLVVPDSHGEKIESLHARISHSFTQLIESIDKAHSDDMTILICGHAAQIIASGRALTGNIPQDYDEDDFQCFTCGISRFERRDMSKSVGGFECVLNSDCAHLPGGEERGWKFHGDESFDSYEGSQGKKVIEANGTYNGKL